MIGAILAKRKARIQFDLLNARDLDRYLEAMAEDVTFEFPGKVPGSGTHVGKAALRAFFESMFELHPESRFTVRHIAVDNIWSMSGTNTLLVEWDLDYSDQAGHWFHNSGVTSGSTRAGKIVRIRDFIFDWDVLAEANALAGDRPS